MSPVKESSQKAPQQQKRAQKPESQAPAGGEFSVQEGIQSAGLEAASPSIRTRAALALQRSAGNRAFVQMLRRTRREPLPQEVKPAPETLIVQMRRMPEVTSLHDILTATTPAGPANAENYDAHAQGLRRLISRAIAEMTPAEQGAALANIELNVGIVAFLGLPERQQLEETVRAILAVRSDLQLGDPALIDIGARTGTADAANIAKLVENANRIFDAVASGSRNTDLRQVFGRANAGTARFCYSEARRWMNRLHTTGHIVTDRSGYNAEVGLGGLTGFHVQISLEPDAIDNPDENENVITMIHESMHAGNRNVDDRGYIDREDEFRTLGASDKLRNAAHYEVIARRMLSADYAYDGETFTPAGTRGPGGTTTPTRTPREQAIRAASETFREAWTLALNLHMLYVRVYRTPSEWDSLNLDREYGTTGRRRFSQCLPFWSKVEKLTIHEKTVINPTGGVAATNPVSSIDVALSEGVTRKLSTAMGGVPQEEGPALAFETAHATPAELTAAGASVAAERDLLIKLVLREVVHDITGSLDRDIRMVNRMATAGDVWNRILAVRSPADFAD